MSSATCSIFALQSPGIFLQRVPKAFLGKGKEIYFFQNDGRLDGKLLVASIDPDTVEH